MTEASLREIAVAAERGRKSGPALERIGTELELRQQALDTLEDRLSTATENYETTLLEAAIAETEAAAQADEARWLRRRLSDLQDFDGAFGDVPADDRTTYPNDFDELVGRLDDLADKGVIFTGNRKAIPDLDEFDTLNRAVKLAWEALLVLVDYVRSRVDGKCDQGVKQYLENTPQGYRAVAPNKFAEKETTATMNAQGSTRLFPVSLEVSTNGSAFMEAHFKLGKLGRITPRMHYVDFWPSHGRIYVGYIGPHLPTATDG